MITKHLHLFFSLIFFVISSCQSSESNNQTEKNSRFITSTFINPKIIRDKNYQVFLPRSYSKNDSKSYPVLYMMDGQNLFIDSLAYGGFSWKLDQVIDSLVDKEVLKEVIIVAVEHAGVNRFSEYMPQKPMTKIPSTTASSMMQAFELPVYSDNFLTFLTDHLKPIIDKKYRTKSDSKNTFIGGSSMGGLISMYAVCEYPEVFGGAMCLSTHWIVAFDDSSPEASEALINYFSKNLPKGKKWYFDYGTKGLDQYYEPWQNQIDSILERNNYLKNQNWMTKKYDDHDHNERFWNMRLDVPLKFILGKK